MGGHNRTGPGRNDKDVDNKLEQYMLISKQISKTLASQRVQIAKLKDSLSNSTSEKIRLQRECHKWKKKFLTIRTMYIDHIHSITSELQSNADKINSISDGEMGENDDNETSHPLACPTTASTRNDNSSRRASKSFESTKNRSVRSMDYLDIDTIDEENEEESSFEVSAERKEDGGSVEDDSDLDGSEKEGDTDEESGDSDEGSDSNEVSAENEDESEESEESEASDDESEADGEADGEANSVGEDEQASGNDIEVENEDGDISTSISEAENRSDSVEQISLLTTNYDSTLKNKDSNKKNGKTSSLDPSISAQSISENSQSFISVDNQSSNKSTPQKSLNKLPASKRTIRVRRVNVSENDSIQKLTFGTTKVKKLISSTPYRKNNLSNVASAEISILSPAHSTRSRSNISNSAVTMEAQVSKSSGITANGSQLSAPSLSSRPKRKVAPVILSEPKLNTKLRRP